MYICITSPHTVELGHVVLRTMEVEHELTATVVVITYNDVVTIGEDDMCISDMDSIIHIYKCHILM